MSEFNYDKGYGNSNYSVDAVAKKENALMRDVYVWMTGALVITGLAAYYVSTSEQMLSLIFGSRIAFFGLMIAEIGLVIGLNAAINKISAMTATLMFLLYSLLNGVTLASIFLVYDGGTLATTFFVTAGTFGAMALYGSVTNKDLTKLGTLFFFGLIGIIIASIVNIFLGNSMLELIISAIGVVIFIGLTAYDAQKIKQMLYGAEVNDTTQKIAVVGALSLYLDFVNLFLYLLRFFGRRD